MKQRHLTMASLVCAALLKTPAAEAQVGMRQASWDGIQTTLTYPTAQPASPVAFGPYVLAVALNAPADDRPHPLVVMSHGTGGGDHADHALAASLARAGFVVAQPIHPGDNHRDMRQAGPVAFERRPHDVIRLMDALAGDAYWADRLDLRKVGVHGMSAGGVTALSLAGAQWSLLGLLRHCAEHADNDAGFCFNGALEASAQAERRRRFGSVRQVPDEQLPPALRTAHGGLIPSPSAPDPRPDPRVAAISLMVPVAAIFSADSLARIRIPVAVVSAALDTVLLPRFHSDRVLTNVPGVRHLADLSGGHFDVLWPWPDAVAHSVAVLQVRGGEPTPGFDPSQREAAHARIVEFHRQHLLP